MKKRLLSLLLIITMVVTMLPAIPVYAQTAWDGSTKTEPIQTDDVYQISSGAELAWFADYVNTLGAADTGLVDVDAVLTDDIDLGNQPWTPIGLISYVVDAYAGTFDGQNHTVSNLKIDASAANYGLFGIVNTGTVKNLKVEGNVSSNNVAGGIIGKLQTGTVENCLFRGSVSTSGKTTKGYAGGIIGTVAAKGAVITGCCNTAEINGTYAGGILGYNKNNAAISSCYNTGHITGTTRSAGIAGQQSSGTISYCYNIGNSANGISGFSNATITNCYYLNDETSEPGGTATGYEKITDKASLLESLNAGAEKLFCEDTININNGYPVFTWQLSSAVISVPVSSVTILGDAVTGSTLTAQALGAKDEGATNVQYQWAISEDNQNFTDVADAAGSTFDIPDTGYYVDNYIKVTVTGEEDSTAFAVIGPVRKSDSLIEKENTEKVQAALELLTLDTTVVKEKTNLNLPTEINGCSVSWTSSDSAIISDAGIVTLPDKNIVSVTLTAVVACGTSTASKTFDIDVWAADIDADVYLQNVLDSMEWNFKLLQPVFGEDTNILVKFQNILKNKGYGGVTVTIQSTADEQLISKNGKIYYPAIPEGGSFADGKQVQTFFNLTVEDKTVVYPTSNMYALLVPWDKSDVQNSLDISANEELKEAILCGDNSSLASVSSDLHLPSCIKGDKYSFAWITWKSSDEAHLAVSNENRQSGADSLYNPYVGKVYQDSEEHKITLTAAITNPSTDVTTTRTYEVTVNPLSADQLNQTIDKMTAILHCYTADKLTNFATKEPLNTDAVDNDIQLVIPKKVVTAEELANLDYGQYWDYWNYKFTVSSSDTNIIEINSFRANVYRPLGEDSSADKQVTLTVKLESKANPNIFVTKDITVTVKHLSREEINNALDLMDQAKSNYTQGLLGNNADSYSIIDNLTPYREIVWNKEKSGVDFNYDIADMQGNGIVVDELPDWEEQEDWRLFHTGNKDLISNETLILNETPEEDTFVKINSVLTDEILGKYYTKFQNDKSYDAEALAKFKQLYKQPVSAYVMAVGAGNYTETFAAMPVTLKASAHSTNLSSYKNEIDKPILVSFTLLGLNGAAIIAKTQESSFTKGATVFDVFKKVLADNDVTYTAKGSYVSSINGLSEFDHGKKSGWMYTVGNVYVNSYMNAQELSGGEDIVVKYVTDYTLANPSYSSDYITGSQAANGQAGGTNSTDDENNTENTENESNINHSGNTTGYVPAKKNTVLKDTADKCKVRVISASKKNPTVEYVKSTDVKAKTITIPSTVTINKVTYKVIQVASNAFRAKKKVTKIIIGKNVKTIGKNAFKNCTALKTVVVKTSKLTKKSIAKTAFKGTKGRVIVKVPAKKWKAYRTYFKNKGNNQLVVKSR